MLANFLSNAIKYSLEGGPIEVSVAVAGGRAVLAVSDRGIGIPPGEIEELFLPFRWWLPPGATIAGAGLGLSIVRRLVEAQGGRTEMESAPGSAPRSACACAAHRSRSRSPASPRHLRDR